MLAPIDKATRGGNDIVQVVITRNCDLFSCSNCTQLLPFRKDVREMTLECAELALRSLEGWPGVISLFGGNPCTHSRFPELCDLWKQYIPDQRKRGLWTNDLRDHGQVVKDTFWPRARFNLNTHGSSEAHARFRRWLPGVPVFGTEQPSRHAGILMDRRDLGVRDEEWEGLRESCDINRRWSSAIFQGPDGSPRAYFCEVAGALSGVRGEDNGVPAIPGWWREPMSHFAGQVASCCDRGCGVPLRARGHLDHEGIYDVTDSWHEATQKRAGRVSLEAHMAPPERTHEVTDYLQRKKR